MPITVADYEFAGPFADPSSLEDRSGLYAIICRKAGSSHLTDVGESSSVRDRVENHDRRDCWETNCVDQIVYAALYTPNLQQQGRKGIEREIRDKYAPPCGRL